MKKILMTILMLFVIVGLAVAPCGATSHGKTEGTDKKPMMAKKQEALKPPVIKLDRVEIASYWGWIDPARSSSPLVLAFVFALENPNKANVMLDDLRFTVAFEDFEVNTVMYYDDNYVPGGKTDYLRVNVVLDSGVTNGMLLVSRGHTLIEMIERKEITKSHDLLERWWKGVADFNFPISVRNGTATFVGPGDKPILVPFEGVFPPKK
ncbi:MAG: hypothetical protein QMD32_00215 [Smithellaceae bacterium]|nr:hypothetical protein [Smithellaceae bacterium]